MDGHEKSDATAMERILAGFRAAETHHLTSTPLFAVGMMAAQMCLLAKQANRMRTTPSALNTTSSGLKRKWT